MASSYNNSRNFSKLIARQFLSCLDTLMNGDLNVREGLFFSRSL